MLSRETSLSALLDPLLFVFSVYLHLPSLLTDSSSFYVRENGKMHLTSSLHFPSLLLLLCGLYRGRFSSSITYWPVWQPSSSWHISWLSGLSIYLATDFFLMLTYQIYQAITNLCPSMFPSIPPSLHPSSIHSSTYFSSLQNHPRQHVCVPWYLTVKQNKWTKPLQSEALVHISVLSDKVLNHSLSISSSAPSFSIVRNWRQLLSVAVFCLLVAELFVSFNPTVSLVFTYPTSEQPPIGHFPTSWNATFTLPSSHSWALSSYILTMTCCCFFFYLSSECRGGFKALLALSLSPYFLPWLLKP